MERAPTAETPKPKPKPQAPEEGGELKEEKCHPLTLSQCMKQLLEQAEEMMSKAKISSPTSSDKKKEECGCTENCSCAKAKEGGFHKEKENAHKTEEKGKKLDCGCTGTCACPSSSSSPGTKTEKAPEGAKKKKQEAQA